MSSLFLSDNFSNNNNIIYIRDAVHALLLKNQKDYFTADKHRASLLLTIDDSEKLIATEEILDKISDVIAVGYKYDFFNKQVRTVGLNREKRELLITALISADISDDKRYICSKCKISKEIAIDGIYNFRLTNLKKKWSEICGYIPEFFSEDELKDFIVYLVKERANRAVTILSGGVFDRFGNLLKRTRLLPNSGNLNLIKEVLLSGAGEVIVKDNLSNKEESYLKEYFGEKILFKVD